MYRFLDLIKKGLHRKSFPFFLDRNYQLFISGCFLGMLVQVVCASESQATAKTLERLLSSVESVSQLDEFLTAVRTEEGFLSRMNSSMFFHVYQPLEQALCSWGHGQIFSQDIFPYKSYSFKNPYCREFSFFDEKGLKLGHFDIFDMLFSFLAFVTLQPIIF